MKKEDKIKFMMLNDIQREMIRQSILTVLRRAFDANGTPLPADFMETTNAFAKEIIDMAQQALLQGTVFDLSIEGSKTKKPVKKVVKKVVKKSTIKKVKLPKKFGKMKNGRKHK